MDGLRNLCRQRGLLTSPWWGFLSHPMARDILAVLPEVVAVLPHDEMEAVLSDLPRMT